MENTAFKSCLLELALMPPALKINIDNYYPDDWRFLLGYALICWVVAKTDTRFTIFDSSVLKKQLRILRVARTEAFAENQRTLYERNLCL
jgi:hypothetical protein